MSRFIKKIVVITMAGLMCQAATADLFESGFLGLVLPDNNSLGVTDTLSVSEMEGGITNISVSIDLGATTGGYAYNGDIYLFLVHEVDEGDDKICILMNRPGKTAANSYGSADDGFDVIFTLTGSDIHFGDAGGGTLTGPWAADGRETDPDDVLGTDDRTALLSEFLGSDANGDWTLFAADMNSGGTAQINNWSLTLETVPEPTVIMLLLLSGGGLMIGRRVKEHFKV